MRFIPVIDLLDGHAVHAIKGDRARYRPVKSVLCKTSDPLDLAQAFRDRLGLREIYIADLNAIQTSGTDNHAEAIAALARLGKMDIILDAGISDVATAQTWMDHGVGKLVVGSETLSDWNALYSIPLKIGQDNLVFSLDLRAGITVSRCAALAKLTIMEALAQLQRAGWKDIILLDLCRVGSNEGADHALAAKAHGNFPAINLFIGGGIANPEELEKLKSAGIAGVLLATALHTGMVDADCIARLQA